MDYRLYTLVDISHTGQYRNEPGKEIDRWREQNFNTVIQTLGIRANVHFRENPFSIDVAGKLVGFDTDEIIRLWRFDFSTEREDALYEVDSDPVGYLKQDFHLVPYISGLGESMEQKYAVFNTQDPGKNIVFHLKQ
jgi:hypothetical protein